MDRTHVANSIRKPPPAWVLPTVFLGASLLVGCDPLVAPPTADRAAGSGPVSREKATPNVPANGSPPRDSDGKEQVLIGRVVRVADGDTLTVADNSGGRYKIRLAGIDAPELAQPFGRQSRDALSTAARDKAVHVRWRERDQFDRVLGTVYVGDVNINEQQVRDGWAWRYLHSRDAGLAAAERAARADRAGLWSSSQPEPPWEFRRREQRAALRR